MDRIVAESAVVISRRLKRRIDLGAGRRRMPRQGSLRASAKRKRHIQSIALIWVLAIVSVLWPVPTAWAQNRPVVHADDPQDGGNETQKRPQRKKAKPIGRSQPDGRIRWGQRRSESDEAYDRRYRRMLRNLAG